MNKAVSFAVASILLLAPAGAMAQQGAVRQACAADIKTICAGVQPGGGRIKACVKEHFTELSDPCKQALLTTATVVKACKADAQQNCTGIQPGGGRIQACMKDHFMQLSTPCQEALLIAKLGKR